MKQEFDRTPFLVRRARLLMGMTQEAFSEEFEVDPATVSRWERGKLHPAPNVWKRIREITLHVAGPLSDEVVKASPVMKRISRMEDLKTSKIVSKGLLEKFGILPGEVDATAMKLVPKTDPLYCVSSSHFYDIVQADSHWLKGGVVYAEGHCLSVALNHWVDVMVAPLPDRDAALIEFVISHKGEDRGFRVHVAHTHELF